MRSRSSSPSASRSHPWDSPWALSSTTDKIRGINGLRRRRTRIGAHRVRKHTILGSYSAENGRWLSEPDDGVEGRGFWVLAACLCIPPDHRPSIEERDDAGSTGPVHVISRAGDPSQHSPPKQEMPYLICWRGAR
ncbi:hypothetical protein BDZ97DRAFT_1193463 [Flammula alnicola]|nr:hypothetical protein BDZ97DRAFT_1193463 [Flammula alnicola]